MTNRELIKLKSEELRDIHRLGPIKASEQLVGLASLLFSLNEEITEKHFKFNEIKLIKLIDYETASKANIYAQASMEYKEFIQAMNDKEALEELIRAIKYYLKSAQTEYREFTN